MMNKTKKLSIVSAVTAFAVCSACGVAVLATQPQDNVDSQNSRNESVRREESVGWYSRNGVDGYELAADGTITTSNTVANEGWNFYLNGDSQAYGDYTVSADISATIQSTADGGAQLGLVPWYVDSNNYIVTYAQWWAGDRNGQMACLQMTGKINGNFFAGSEWNDQWTVGVTTTPHDGVKLTVEKSGNSFSATLTDSNGQLLKSVTLSDANFVENKNAVYGIYAGDMNTYATQTATFSNIFMHKWQATDNAVYTANADGTVKLTSNASNWMNVYVDKSQTIRSSGVLSMDIVGTVSEDNGSEINVGVSPWYVDENNWIVIYCKWWAGDRPGQMTDITLHGKINGANIAGTDGNGFRQLSWADNIYAPSNQIHLTVTKTGGKFDMSLTAGSETKSGSMTIDGFVENENAHYGVYGNGDLFTFSDIEYTSNVHYVTFDVKGGTLSGAAVQEVQKSSGKVTKPTDPTRVGYTFGGWYTDEACTNEFNFDTATIDGDTTLYAKWVLDQRQVTFDYNDGETANSVVDVDYNTTATEPTDPTREGYTFMGWFVPNSDVPFNFSTPITEDITLVAKWGKDVVMYTVTFETNGAGDIQSVRVAEGGKVAAPTVSREGYTLVGWFTDEELTQPYDFDDDTVTGNTTLYAKWNAITYTATLVYDDGNTPNKTVTVAYNGKLTAPQTPVRNGYIFGGWYAEGENTPYDFSTVLTGDITLTARWFVDAGWRGGSGYIYDDETDKITANNSSGYFINRNERLAGSYKFSVQVKGTKTLPVTADQHVGIVPWYLDEDNFIRVYVEYQAGDRPGDIREMQITGEIDGAEIGWHDIWCDGIHVAPADGYTLEVELKRNADGNMIVVPKLLSYDGSRVIKDGSDAARVLPALNKYAAIPFMYGVYATNDSYVYENYTVTRLGDADDHSEYEIIDSDTVAKSGGSAWTVADGKYSVDGGANDVSDTMLVKTNYITGTTYTLSADIDSMTDTVGLVAWYKDEDNYILAVAGGGKYGFEGKLGGTAIAGTLVDVPDSLATATPSNVYGNITVIKRGSSLELLLDDMQEGEGVKFSHPSILNAASYGLCATDAVTFSNVVVDDSIDYLAYSWYTATLNGKDTFISAKQQNGISYDGELGAYVFGDVGVGEEQDTAAYWATDYYAKAETSVEFSNIQATTEYGVYGWLQDENNNLLVKVTPTGVVMTYKFGSYADTKTFELPQEFEYAGEHTLALAVVDDTVTITLDGETVAQNEAFEGADHDSKIRIGLTVKNTGVTAKVTSSGFVSMTPVVNGEWTLYGNRYNTWTVENDTTVKGSLVGSTVFLRTLAAKNNTQGLRDYYVSADINITESTGNEWKAGFAPYYVDSDNYIFVWLTRWADASPMVGVTIKINGSVVGNEWRETSAAYDFFGNNTLEVGIVGNKISVYLNKQFGAIVSYDVDELADMRTDGKAALYIGNTSATFSDIVMFSANRTKVNSEKPTISIIGTKPTTGTVGSKITLPITNASNSAGDILTVDKKVVGPNGEVEIEKNAFTPTVAGKYTVTLSCTDMWGNTTVETFEITVAGEGGGEGEGGEGTGGENNAPKKNNSLALGLGLGLPLGLAAIAVAVVLLLMKKGIIKLRKSKNGENSDGEEEKSDDAQQSDGEEAPVEALQDDSSED